MKPRMKTQPVMKIPPAKKFQAVTKLGSTTRPARRMKQSMRTKESKTAAEPKAMAMAMVPARRSWQTTLQPRMWWATPRRCWAKVQQKASPDWGPAN